MKHIIGKAFGMALCAALLAAALVSTINPTHAQFTGPIVLPLINGWTSAPFNTSGVFVERVQGIVQFRGAMATSGANPAPFTLGPAFRPLTDVYVPVDLCNATKGRLHITPSGAVVVQAENNAFSNAACFTSLDGVSFALRATGFTTLTLVNGWTNAPFSTSNAAVALLSGVVHFKGAIATSGTNPVAFTLPASFRPATDVYIPVDLCNATNGRLHITPAGIATVEAEGGNFTNAQCFTSLDGATFVRTPMIATALTLINGWTNAPFSTSNAAAENAYGVVHFKGAIATTGTSAQPFVLPQAFRPITAVYVPIDLCNATNGRLEIDTVGNVTVQAEDGTFSNVQCFTSLDGAHFVQ